MAKSDPFTLPTIEFVGGETQTLIFCGYFFSNNMPFDFSLCNAEFAVVDAYNRTTTDAALLTKTMTSVYYSEMTVKNAWTVTLTPTDTVNFYGKYYYQITIIDETGTTEIPMQGIMYITNNINKAYI